MQASETQILMSIIKSLHPVLLYRLVPTFPSPFHDLLSMQTQLHNKSHLVFHAKTRGAHGTESAQFPRTLLCWIDSLSACSLLVPAETTSGIKQSTSLCWASRCEPIQSGYYFRVYNPEKHTGISSM